MRAVKGFGCSRTGVEMGRGLGKFGVGWRIEQLSEESESLTGVGCVDEEIHAQH